MRGRSLEFGGMMQCTMKRIIIWNGHAQPMFPFSDLGWPRELSFSECLACDNYEMYNFICAIWWSTPCLSTHVSASFCLSVPFLEAVSPRVFTQFSLNLQKTFTLWEETKFEPFNVNCQISSPHKPKQSMKQVKFGVSRHFLDNAWGNGPNFAMLMYPDHVQNWLILAWDFGPCLLSPFWCHFD